MIVIQLSDIFIYYYCCCCFKDISTLTFHIISRMQALIHLDGVVGDGSNLKCLTSRSKDLLLIYGISETKELNCKKAEWGCKINGCK